MASTRIYLDRRHLKKDLTAPLLIALRNGETTAFINIGISILPSQWDINESKVNNTHPQFKALNTRLAHIKSEIDIKLLELSEQGGIKKHTALQLKKLIMGKINPDDCSVENHSFVNTFKDFMMLKSDSTREIYKQTFRKIALYTNIDNLNYDDITTDWLNRFDRFLARTAPSRNARNIHFRNIRAVFNYAIDNEYTSDYPFRRYKIRPEATRKRSLTVEELRKVFDYPVEEYAVIYRDLFKLIFMFIGINVVDLYRLKEIRKGRVEYSRAKTHRLYSIKVEPEAMEIINKYKGTNGLLCISDRWTDYRNFRHQINKALQRFGYMKRVGRGGKKVIIPEFPGLTTYWARHTWATIAAELDIPDAIISQALGHAGENSTTDIYIKRNPKKVDEANRKVLDWVLYGKK